jgi:PAS domain S-box-containing protein
MDAETDNRDSELERLRQQVLSLQAKIARLQLGQIAAEQTHSAERLRVNSYVDTADGGLREGDTSGDLILESATGYAILTTDLDGCVTAWNEGARLLLGWEESEALGRDARMIFTPEDRLVGAPEQEMEGALTKGRAEDERWHIRKDGSRFWASGLMMPLKGPDDATRGFLKILRDRTEELHAARNQLRRLEQMKALAEAARAVLSAPSLGTTLQAITDAARHIIGAHQAVCSITRGSDWSQAITAASLSDKYSAWKNYARLPEGSGIYAWVCEGSRTVRMTQAELEAHPRWRGFGAHAPEHPPMRGWLAAALTGSDGRNLGLIQLSDKEEGEFDDADEAILVQLAQFAASAIVRAQAEEEVQKERARLALATSAGEIGIWDWDLNTDQMSISDQGQSILGISRDGSVAPLEFFEFIHPEDRDRVAALSRHALDPETRSREPYEYRILRSDGMVRWVLARGEATFEEQSGQIRATRYSGTIQDITARREAEEAESQAAQRLRLAIGAGRLAVWDLDVATNMVTGSPDVSRLLGFPEGQPIDAEEARLRYCPGEYERIQAESAVVMARGETSNEVEFRYQHPDLGVRWLRLRYDILFNAEGQPTRVIGVMSDETDRREAEEQLRELNATLEQRVTEAVTERAQAEEALRQSQKMEAVGQLTGGIAHDFNNLLAGIVGSLDLMQTRITQGRTTELSRYVGAAMGSAQRAAALTHRLLAFSRRQPLDPKPVEANRLVAEMEDLLRRTLGPSISLEMVMAGGLWRTLCDPIQLESALLNLSINARDAMPDGGKLTIETANAHLDDAYAAAQRDVTPGQYVAICISDTGMGMSPDLISRVFEPFFTTKPLGQGTGLGLSMVYGFAKQSEGHVRIYSEEGKGTTVKLYLPRYRGADNEEEDAQAQVIEAPRAEAGETVLVVEDEPVIRDLIIEVLGDLGYQALEAGDGPSGLKILQSKRRIDLLITDVGLPGLNGRQLADQARERRPDLKVLFITGYAENATLANGFLEPGMAMMTKPFAVDALARKIGQLLEGQATGESSNPR